MQKKRPSAGKADYLQVKNKPLLMPKIKQIKVHFVE